MGRRILAVVVSLIAAFAVIMIVEMMSTPVVPQPGSEIMNDPVKLREFMAGLPVTFYVVVLIGYFLGSFIGGYLVTSMSRRESPGVRLPLLIGSILMIGGILNFVFLLPGQPVWFVIAALLIFIPVALIGSKLAGR